MGGGAVRYGIDSGITFPAFPGFFVWMASMGVLFLRRQERGVQLAARNV
jgi:hypothetical protein